MPYLSLKQIDERNKIRPHYRDQVMAARDASKDHLQPGMIFIWPEVWKTIKPSLDAIEPLPPLTYVSINASPRPPIVSEAPKVCKPCQRRKEALNRLVPHSGDVVAAIANPIAKVINKLTGSDLGSS